VKKKDSTEDKANFIKVLSSDLYNDCNSKQDELDFDHLQVIIDGFNKINLIFSIFKFDFN
jgi:hypothetical protein